MKAFHGPFTKQLAGAPGLSRTFAVDVMCNPLLLAICDRVLLPSCARYQLNLGHLLQRGPGSDEQLLHRDELVWSDMPRPGPELQLATVIAFVDFTRENGATRVVPGSHRWPAPYATQLLAELGAEVLKVEPPGGDPMRVYAGLFASLSADKRSVVLDLKDDSDRARALELAAEADVVIEGYRPGVADRLGIGYEAVRVVNPSVIYCSVSGLGQDGALSQASGHDINYLAWSGALAPEGGLPREPAVPVADLSGGMAAAFAICAAVVRKLKTGEGERIDVAMADVLATWTRAVTTEDWADPATGFPVRFVHHPATRHEPPPAVDEHRGEGFRPR